MADGVYVLRTVSIRRDEGTAMWVRSKLRKNRTCAATGKPLLKGERHYRPIGNMDYRSWRVHREYVEAE